MRTQNNILYISFLLSFLISLSFLHAQNNTHFINGCSYFKQDSIWYVTDNYTNKNFRVNTNSITVKLKNSYSFPNLQSIISSIQGKIKRQNILGYIDIYIPNEIDIFNVWETLNSSGLFESVEINSYGELLFSTPALTTPNDPLFSNQYYLNHPTYPDINATEGWELCNNFGEGIIVAVLDNGFDYLHPDLNVWPDVGWDYVGANNTSILITGRKKPHATMVAGEIGAMTNNSIGISGIAGGLLYEKYGVQLMSVAIGTLFLIENDDLDDAILYSVLNGAKILNFACNAQTSNATNAALSYTYNNGRIIIAAAGNDFNAPTVWYPASNSNVIAVAGINKNWVHHGNYGQGLEITAPAQDLLTTSYYEQDSLHIYEQGSGTSGSAPMVSGAAALLWADYPSLTNFDIRRIIKSTAHNSFTGYNSLYFGSGLLKIDSMFRYAANMPVKPNISIYAPVGGHPTISWNPVPGVNSYKIYRAQDSRMELAAITSTSNTSYTDNIVTVMHPKFAPYTYYYRVASLKDGYESPISNEVSCGSNSTQKISVDIHNEPNVYQINQNYPNPFNPITTIKYSLEKNSFTQLKVYDILGREVKTLVNSYQSAGEHFVKFNGRGLASGVYFYSLTAGDFSQTKKMILLP